jgi:hypothetical protein
VPDDTQAGRSNEPTAVEPVLAEACAGESGVPNVTANELCAA